MKIIWELVVGYNHGMGPVESGEFDSEIIPRVGEVVALGQHPDRDPVFLNEFERLAVGTVTSVTHHPQGNEDHRYPFVRIMMR